MISMAYCIQLTIIRIEFEKNFFRVCLTPSQEQYFSKIFFHRFSMILKRYCTQNLMLIPNVGVSDCSFLGQKYVFLPPVLSHARIRGTN